MAVHESQSLIIEMQACRSDAFLGLARPGAARRLRRRRGAVCAGEPRAPVAPGRARLHPRRRRRDDLSRACHPALPAGAGADRGRSAVADLPGAWRDGMQALLGIVPPDDARGCLQDIHWYDGAVRLFPELHAGRDGRGAADGGGAPGGATGSTRRSAAASWRRCSAGCGRACTRRAAGSASTTCCSAPPASRSIRPTSKRTSPGAIWAGPNGSAPRLALRYAGW